MRAEFLGDHDRVHATIEELQSALDEWVAEYNTNRPHQSLGDRPPARAIRSGRRPDPPTSRCHEIPDEVPLSQRPPGVNRWVDQRGSIALGGLHYRVGPTFAGEPVEVVVRSGLSRSSTPVCSSPPTPSGGEEKGSAPRACSTLWTIPAADVRHERHPPGGPGGSVSFAGAGYRVGRSWARQVVEVAIVAGSVQISAKGKVIRVHAIRHDRSKEHGAFATPQVGPVRPRWPEGNERQAGTGATPSSGYRVLTLRTAPFVEGSKREGWIVGAAGRAGRHPDPWQAKQFRDLSRLSPGSRSEASRPHRPAGSFTVRRRRSHVRSAAGPVARECDRMDHSPTTLRTYRSQIERTIRPSLGKVTLTRLTAKNSTPCTGP